MEQTNNTSKVVAADAPVAVNARFYAAPGRESEVEAYLLSVVAYVRKVEPELSYRLMRSRKNPAEFVFHEIYPSDLARENHGKVTLPNATKALGAAPADYFARPPDIEAFSPFD